MCSTGCVRVFLEAARSISKQYSAVATCPPRLQSSGQSGLGMDNALDGDTRAAITAALTATQSVEKSQDDPPPVELGVRAECKREGSA